MPSVISMHSRSNCTGEITLELPEEYQVLQQARRQQETDEVHLQFRFEPG